ncbi:hypothetical protein PLIIFM63780_004044 [Purpureocillium lilacinum]|nr:hypothetical protein PLIIFM63780_004044 [Purpureocillium lilacinum]
MPCREEDEPVMQELELLKREEAKAEAEAEEQQLNERARILWLANRQRIHDEAPRYVDGLPVRDVLRPPRHQYQQQQPGKHHPHQSESTMAVVVAGHAEENSQQEEYHAKVRAAMERIREARDGPARVRQRGDGGLVMARTGAWALPMRKKRDDKED